MFNQQQQQRRQDQFLVFSLSHAYFMNDNNHKSKAVRSSGHNSQGPKQPVQTCV